MVEHAIRLELGLVDNQRNRQRHADGERGRHVGVRPRVGVLGPREPHAEEDETRGQQTVPNPVQPTHLLTKGELRLQRQRQGAVGQGEDEGRQEEERHDNVRKVAVPVRVAVAQERAADDQAEDEPQARGHHEDALAPGPPLARQDLPGHGVEERLRAKGDARDAEAGQDHVEVVGQGDDERAHAPKETADDGEPFSAPVVGGLGEDRAQDDGENGQDRGGPAGGAGGVEFGGDGVRLLEKERVERLEPECAAVLLSSNREQLLTAPAPTRQKFCVKYNKDIARTAKNVLA